MTEMYNFELYIWPGLSSWIALFIFNLQVAMDKCVETSDHVKTDPAYSVHKIVLKNKYFWSFQLSIISTANLKDRVKK